MSDGFSFRLVAVPLGLIMVVVYALFLDERLPLREVLDIWLPWTVIMLAVATALFAVFFLAARTGGIGIRLAAVVLLLSLAVLGGSALLSDGDRLSRVPIGAQGLLCLGYAAALLWQILACDLKWRR